MKTITLTQPWATLIAVGAKRIETRSWSTGYRGPIAIHAAKGLADMSEQDLAELVAYEPFFTALGPARKVDAGGLLTDLPRGKVVAIAQLAGCCKIAHSSSAAGLASADSYYESILELVRYRGYHIIMPPPEPEYSFGNYAPGRFAWVLKDVRPLAEPIPARGALGLWEWTPPEGFMGGQHE